MKRPRADKKPTWTHLIEEHLGRIDDFATAPQLQAATGANGNQVSAALHALRAYKAVDAIVAEGQLWFFLTPTTDTRLRTCEARVPEEPGTRNRRKVAP